MIHLASALLGKLLVDERMLVFFECCQQAESFAKEYNFTIYHSKLSNSDIKDKNLHFWNRSATNVMGCTSIFGFRVDCPNIHFVVIFNPKYSLLTTIWMAGQAGWDGRETHIFLATLEQLLLVQKKNDYSFMSELRQLVH